MSKYLYLTTILLVLIVSVIPTPVWAAERGAKTEVQATIPYRTYLRIFGYTAPNALVQAEAYRVFAQTSSDREGYFQFNEVPISYEAKELCLTTIDAQRRTGFPLCIYIPETDQPSEIGPLLLSPTLSLSVPLIWQNQTAYLDGQTIPNSQVRVSFFEVPKENLALTFYNGLAKLFSAQVYAFDLPSLMVQTDNKGNYSVNLPSSKAVGFRVFTKAFFKDAPTPKSQTLAFSIGAITRYFYLYILPWIFFFLILILFSTWAVTYERKTKRGRILFAIFNEKRLKPFAIRSFLGWKRIWYNLQDYLRSYRK